MRFSKELIGFIIGLFLSAEDVVNLGLVKKISIGDVERKWLWIPVLLYSFQPLIFLRGLQYTTLTVLNLSWDLLSDVLVTAIGLFYFKEKLTRIKLLGLIFAFISIGLFAWDDIVNGCE